MKKIGIVSLLILLAATMAANPVDIKTAEKAAETFMLSITNTRIDLQLIDYADQAEFPNFYVFGTDNSFVIISADDCVRPVLGYSTENPFGTEKMPENAFCWLKGYDAQIADASAISPKTTSETEALWNSLLSDEPSVSKENSEVIVAPLIETQWNQNSPYNNSCPSGTVTGCVATAMAQIMNYWNWPTQGNGSHSYTPQTHPEFGELSANFGSTTYDWGNMLNSYSSGYNEDQEKAVATLMYHCGVSVEMDYTENSSGAYSLFVPDAWINYFRYSPHAYYAEKENYTDTQWIALLKSELDESRPVYYCGSYIENNKPGGHAFVCDGYNSNNEFHFNWGWGGQKDGYFAIGSLNPNPGSPGIGSGHGTYNLLNAIVALAEPLSSLPAPTLTTAVNSNGISLSWDPVAGATSYNVYKDNVRIATGITNFTYEDNSVSFGEYYDYYVRAVSSEPNVKSNPSNRVTTSFLSRDITPSNLTASTESDGIHLQWEEYPANLSTELHYATVFDYSGYNSGETNTYWGHRYPSSMINPLNGMLINKVSAHFFFAGEYTLYIYNGSLDNLSNRIYSDSFTINNTEAVWKEFVFDEPLQINCEEDLWIVFYTSSTSTTYPATVGHYYGNDCSNADYLSSSFETLSSTHLGEPNYSWLIITYLTDGTYSYNLYDNGTKVNTNPIPGTNFTLTELGNGIHPFTVKTKYSGGESKASNTTNITVGNVSLPSLTLEDDNLTITPNSSLTIDGAITNDDPANLLIEDGAQLIHPNSAVKATLKKAIEGFENDGTGEKPADGWYTIASPVNAASVSLVTEGQYDLYVYDEKNEFWLNQKNNANNITEFKEGYGFLYANADDKSLDFAGDMKATDEQISIPLSYQSKNSNLKGFNLVGNPFTRNLNAGDITVGGTPITTYYVVEGGSELETRAIATYPIKPGQGFLVQANDEGQYMVLNPSSKDDTPARHGFISLEVGNGEFNDRVYVHIGDGNTLSKMTLRNDAAQLSVIKDNIAYAAITIEVPQDEIPIGFKPTQDGTYNLNIDTNNLDLDYLHLIDNITGADVDLLQNQSYTFEAKADDFVSRFRLLFSPIENTNTNTTGITDGVTQILDVTGRIIGTNVNENIKSGVYILRTINGNEIKTEKIIIK